MLQGRKEGERRLRALIEVGTFDLQAIKASAGSGSHMANAVVVTKEPIRRGGDAVRPPSVVVNRRARAHASTSAATSMGC